MDKRATKLLAGTLAALGVTGVTAANFKDVPQKHWAFEEVHWLRADGMLEGWGGKFHGDKDFTRYEMAKVLGRYMKNYDAEKARVEGELGKLRREDQRQEGKITELFGRTDELARRMGDAPPPMAPVRPVPMPVPSTTRSAAPAPAPLPGATSSGMTEAAMAAAVLREIEMGSTLPPGDTMVAPMPVAPTPAPVEPAKSLQERVAEMRARIAVRQLAPAPVATRTSAPTPAPAPTPAAALPSIEPDLLEQALAELSSGGGDVAPVASLSSAAEGRSSGDLWSEGDAARYDTIRDRYRRLIDASGGVPAKTPLPSVPTLAPAPVYERSLPAVSEPLPGDEDQPLPQFYDDQPLPGMGGGSAPYEEGFRSSGLDFDEQLPDVGMPGIGYANGGE